MANLEPGRGDSSGREMTGNARSSEFGRAAFILLAVTGHASLTRSTSSQGLCLAYNI